ncbi:MAG: hypothetical protein JXK51_01710, partial [Halothiobacillaceae bacterium]|nr:hypothetical protein [Halothiobacillaceae bacterium]
FVRMVHVTVGRVRRAHRYAGADWRGALRSTPCRRTAMGVLEIELDRLSGRWKIVRGACAQRTLRHP